MCYLSGGVVRNTRVTVCWWWVCVCIACAFEAGFNERPTFCAKLIKKTSSGAEAKDDSAVVDVISGLHYRNTF